MGRRLGYFAPTTYLTFGGHLPLYQGLAASFAAIPPGRTLTYGALCRGLLSGRNSLSLRLIKP